MEAHVEHARIRIPHGNQPGGDVAAAVAQPAIWEGSVVISTSSPEKTFFADRTIIYDARFPELVTRRANSLTNEFRSTPKASAACLRIARRLSQCAPAGKARRRH